jgi:hypothetical protein
MPCHAAAPREHSSGVSAGLLSQCRPYEFSASHAMSCAAPQFDNTAGASVRPPALVHLQDKRGTFVIEVVGGGLKSRAVIRKGSLHHVARLSAAGTAVTIFDDDMQALTDGRCAVALV